MPDKYGRCRNWWGISYPESRPDNYIDILDSYTIPYGISPLHDRDVYSTGEHKGEFEKEHNHIILASPNKKSYNQIKELFVPIGVVMPEPIDYLRSAVRYLCHLDQPDKFQYDVKDIICGNGFDVTRFLRASASDYYASVSDMIDFIKDNDIVEFQQFHDLALSNDIWFSLLLENRNVFMYINKYIDSRRSIVLRKIKAEKERRELEKKGLVPPPVSGDLIL